MLQNMTHGFVSARSTPVTLSLLPLILLGQCLLVAGTLGAEPGMQEQGEEQVSDDRQVRLIGDGRPGLTPSLGLGEVVLRGVEALLLFPALEIDEGDRRPRRAAG